MIRIKSATQAYGPIWARLETIGYGDNTMRRALPLLILLLTACDGSHKSPPPPPVKIFTEERAALEKAKGVEKTIQDSADAQAKKIDEESGK